MGRKKRCGLTTCEECGVEIQHGTLTKFQGKWRCDDCLEGVWEPVVIPGAFVSNMVAWADQETLATESL